MERAEEYRIRAEEAERQARAAPHEVERLAYEKIAKDWRDLERQARVSEKVRR